MRRRARATTLMSRFTGYAGLVLSLVVPQAHAEEALTQAYVRAGEDGQAVLMRRLDACYAVAPAHVLNGELFARLMGAGGQGRGEADLLQTFGYDLAILRVTGALARQCGRPMGTIVELGPRLTTNALAVVSTVNENGSVRRRRAVINDVGLLNIRIRPSTQADALSKRSSGSLVYVDDEPVGMLMAVNGRTGVGRVLRMDRLMETIRPFFGGAALPKGLEQKMASASDAAEARPGDVAAAARGGAVSEWTVDPLGADYRNANLVDGRGAETQWYGARPEFPVALVVDLAGDEAQVIDRIELVGAGVTPLARRPRDFEILSSLEDEGGWSLLASGTYFQRDERKTVSFMPTRARRVMLRFYSNWGDPEAIGLSAVHVNQAR